MAVAIAKDINVIFYYEDYTNVDDINKAIQSLRETELIGGTKIGGCMDLVYSKKRPNDLITVLLVVTDGNPLEDTVEIDEISVKMRENGFFIQTAGFGDVNYKTLEIITGNIETIIHNKDVSELEKQSEILTKTICNCF
ncbi:von Willebrand factor (vWF) type A domain [Bonamia ostreae]|uniref:von Willebrand factor (VWF) type A domain n=1 Tax=Bonamia ostreae TaxID=126728 RepID=A0ABV2AKN8_9EUKA